MELFAKLFNGFQPLAIFAKSSILDVAQGSEYVAEYLKALRSKLNMLINILKPMLPFYTP